MRSPAIAMPMARSRAELRTPSPGTPVAFAPAVAQDVPTIYLHPGQLHATLAERCTITTILGSCVAICLHDSAKRAGGMNHFLLAGPPPDGTASTRYAPSAMRVLLERMLALGADLSRMDARIVGGANVLSAFANSEAHLGMRNVEVARELVQAAGIRVIAEDVGGTRGRKLVFTPGTGTLWVQRIGQ
ncbi:MAG: cheD [Gemmatimonadetes bacterium]|nr:cheD [Gemmatimonadota bacterium]